MKGQLKVSLRQDLNALVVYDMSRGAVVDEITSFALHQLDLQQLALGTVHAQVLSVAAFWAYCTSKGRVPVSANDAMLREFRDAELVRVLSNKASKHDDAISRGTVNQKLLCVYRWFLWLRETKRIPAHAVGPRGTQIDCPIDVISQNNRRSMRAYRALFRMSATRDRGIRKHLLSDKGCDDILDAIMSSRESLYVRQRNALLYDIGLETGLRRGSINSFEVDQFDRSLVDSASESTVLIKPRRQKFGRGLTYEISVSLLLRICDFIDGPRQQLVDDKRPIREPRRLFLSARDCAPLEDRSITAIFSKLMRSVGAQKGTSFHALRTRFINVQINRELKERLALGLDTSVASVASSVAIRVGHRSSRYLEPYVLVAQNRLGWPISPADTTSLRDAEARLVEQERIIDALRSENKRLRAVDVASRSGPKAVPPE